MYGVVRQALGISAGVEASACIGWGCEDKPAAKPAAAPAPAYDPTYAAAQAARQAAEAVAKARANEAMSTTLAAAAMEQARQAVAAAAAPTPKIAYAPRTIVQQQQFKKGLTFGLPSGLTSAPGLPGAAPATAADNTKYYYIGAAVIAVAAVGYYMTRKA